MRFAVAGLVAVVLALAGCRGEVRTDLNISTANAAAAGQVFKVPVRVGFDMATLTACEAEMPALMVVLDESYGDSHFLGCRADSGRALAEFEIDMPLASSNRLRTPIYLRARAEDGVVRVSLQRDELVISHVHVVLNRGLRPAFRQPMEVEVLARLHNDSAADVAVTLPAGLVNGHMQAAASAVNMARGHTVSLVPQNPADKGLLQASLPLFWWPNP